MFNAIEIYSFIPVSGCVGRAPMHCVDLGSIMLLRRPWIYHMTIYIYMYIHMETKIFTIGLVVNELLSKILYSESKQKVTRTLYKINSLF